MPTPPPTVNAPVTVLVLDCVLTTARVFVAVNPLAIFVQELLVELKLYITPFSVAV